MDWTEHILKPVTCMTPQFLVDVNPSHLQSACPAGQPTRYVKSRRLLGSRRAIGYKAELSTPFFHDRSPINVVAAAAAVVLFAAGLTFVDLVNIM